MKQLRVMLADDHVVVREGLRLLLDAQGDMLVVGEAGTGREAVRQAQSCLPDVVVMDIAMPDLDGAAATAEIKWVCPLIYVLALTRYANQGYLRRMLHAGATGYMVKKTAPEQLIKAVRIVAAGGIFIDASLNVELARHIVDPSDGAHAGRRLSALTERETEVLRLIAWGLSNKESAARLGISEKTVEYHKASAANKLNLRSRTDILRYALTQGWLHDDQDPE